MSAMARMDGRYCRWCLWRAWEGSPYTMAEHVRDQHPGRVGLPRSKPSVLVALLIAIDRLARRLHPN